MLKKTMYIFAIVFLIFNCQNTRQNNIDYFEKKIGKIVLWYFNKYSTVPEYLFNAFDEMYEETGYTLPNRGDYYGNAMYYDKISGSKFLIHSYGFNGLDDEGHKDDLIVIFIINNNKLEIEEIIYDEPK